ncbi:MAG: hypothetical protein MR981_05150, partial [Ruminococcus bromii]|nr:hypothetical protein [Ruminococcus bromii]
PTPFVGLLQFNYTIFGWLFLYFIVIKLKNTLQKSSVYPTFGVLLRANTNDKGGKENAGRNQN